MPFATLAVPFDQYASLPTAQHRWVLMALVRYADRDGICWPSMRQLARDALMSKSSVCRYLADLSQLGVFSRNRRPGGRYRYKISDQFRPPTGRARTVPSTQPAVPHEATQQGIPYKHEGISDGLRWEARLRGWQRRRMWLDFWGPKPSEAACWAPAALIARVMG